jgi:SAM-dependent methyltransferase
MGRRWLHHLDQFESMISPVGEALLTRANYQPGERVVDIGGGGGDSSRSIARRVAPNGSVVSVDISPELTAESQRRANIAGIVNATYIVADAATLTLPAPCDRLHSRFGSMFFAEPAAAFRNLGMLLRAGGRADFGVWAPAKDNAWVSELMGVMRKHIELPKPEAHAPGPFALDDPDYFGGLLKQAGFVDLDFHLWHGTQFIGGAGARASQAADFILQATHFGEAISEQLAQVQQLIKDELLAMFRTHETVQGVAMQANAWMVSATRAR